MTLFISDLEQSTLERKIKSLENKSHNSSKKIAFLKEELNNLSRFSFKRKEMLNKLELLNNEFQDNHRREYDWKDFYYNLKIISEFRYVYFDKNGIFIIKKEYYNNCLENLKVLKDILNKVFPNLLVSDQEIKNYALFLENFISKSQLDNEECYHFIPVERMSVCNLMGEMTLDDLIKEAFDVEMVWEDFCGQAQKLWQLRQVQEKKPACKESLIDDGDFLKFYDEYVLSLQMKLAKNSN